MRAYHRPSAQVITMVYSDLINKMRLKGFWYSLRLTIANGQYASTFASSTTFSVKWYGGALIPFNDSTTAKTLGVLPTSGTQTLYLGSNNYGLTPALGLYLGKIMIFKNLITGTLFSELS